MPYRALPTNLPSPKPQDIGVCRPTDLVHPIAAPMLDVSLVDAEAQTPLVEKDPEYVSRAADTASVPESRAGLREARLFGDPATWGRRRAVHLRSARLRQAWETSHGKLEGRAN